MPNGPVLWMFDHNLSLRLRVISPFAFLEFDLILRQRYDPFAILVEIPDFEIRFFAIEIVRQIQRIFLGMRVMFLLVACFFLIRGIGYINMSITFFNIEAKSKAFLWLIHLNERNFSEAVSAVLDLKLGQWLKNLYRKKRMGKGFLESYSIGFLTSSEIYLMALSALMSVAEMGKISK